MSVYLILENLVHDAEKYEKYKEAAPQFVAKHGGEYLCRGGNIDVEVGDWRPVRVVLIKIPSREDLDSFLQDPGYKPWKELRESLSTTKQMMILDGI